MPVMDGIAASGLFRTPSRASRTTPIVALTANVLPDQVASFLAARMDAHVAKPFDPGELLAVAGRGPLLRGRHEGFDNVSPRLIQALSDDVQKKDRSDPKLWLGMSLGRIRDRALRHDQQLGNGSGVLQGGPNDLGRIDDVYISRRSAFEETSETLDMSEPSIGNLLISPARRRP